MKRIIFTYLLATVTLMFSISISAVEPWVLVKLSVADLRSEPSHKAELASQATMGTPLKVIGRKGVWLEVVGPDNYRAWVNSSSVSLIHEDIFKAWRASRRVIAVNLFETHCYTNPNCSIPTCFVSDIVLGDIMVKISDKVVDGRLHIQLPDGREAWIDSCAVEDFDKWSRKPLVPAKLLEVAQSMYGQPYMWGGTSTKGVDCSGLVRVAYFANGILLQRDAYQQALAGKRILSADSLQTGDLLFFDNVGRGRVTHVGIYDKNGEYIHSSGLVGRNNLRPSSEKYIKSKVMGYVRIAGYENSNGIIRVAEHPWYF